MLHTHLVVRDDALLLYGFATEEERDLFLLLIGVQSVGPKMALAVLSGGSPRDLLAVGYPTNILARFFGAPVVGAQIQLLLTDPRYKYRNEILSS